MKAWNTSGAKIVNKIEQKKHFIKLDYGFYFTAKKMYKDSTDWNSIDLEAQHFEGVVSVPCFTNNK